MAKPSKKSFKHKEEEHVDAVFNYLSMVSKGLKKRTISLEKDGKRLELQLPERAQFSIKAKKKKGEESLSFSLRWKKKKKG